MATARVTRSDIARPLPEGEPRTRHLRVVPEARRRLALRLSTRTGVMLTLVLFVALFAVAVSHALLIESQAELDQLDARVAEEQARYEELRREAAELESPDRVVDEAARLGMVPADEVTWLTPDGTAPEESADEEEEADAPGTSWSDVKPYLEPAP